MNVIEIAKAVAPSIAIEAPATVVSSSDPNAVKLLQMMNEAGREIAMRADWGALEKVETLSGTGTASAYPLPADFARLSIGNAVIGAGGPVRGGLSRDEWLSLTPTEGAPRYFRLTGGQISFYPYPALSDPVQVAYQSKHWCAGGEAFTADDQEPLVPHELVCRGTIWRWKRSEGQDFSDFLAEYEAMLEQMSAFDQRERLP